ncbi:MAG: prepilin-type N-terminal cleavage/methylation domain-containing protein [Synechococcus sp. WH 8007]|nr:prepilin-type N-terminal cleavage/methylation domain-containing protein [Synechococcus sp. WH 8007]
MTASTLKPQLCHALLRNLNAKQPGKKNWLQKGFTLVELMIVIGIVGILSAIALPSFLNQTNKAKGTEAKQKLSVVLKEAHVEWQMTGILADTQAAINGTITNMNTAGRFTYAATVADPVTTATATGNSSDSNIDNTIVYNGCVNLDTGEVEVSSSPGVVVTCL